MNVSLVAAVAENNVIGRDGDLPWRLSGDLQRFKQLTMGHALVMGRKTYESIGRPLPGRVSIVITRQTDYDARHAEVLLANNLDDAIAQTGDRDAFVIGGAQIYEWALPHASRLYLTRVHAEVEGDVQFPEVEWKEWQLIESTDYPADEWNEYAVTWQAWERYGHSDET